MTGTTPVPNKLFDSTLKNLQGAELKVLLVIIRQTLGWEDRRTVRGRKEKDWISSSQLVEKTGCSKRAISKAIDSLVNKLLINVYDWGGNELRTSDMRKGKQQLFYCPSRLFLTSGDNVGITSGKHVEIVTTHAKSAEGLRTNVIGLAQKMRITK